MTSITNYLHFDVDFNTATGRISTLDRDLEITAVRFTSDNPLAPSHQLFAQSPGGYAIQVGGIWAKENNEGRKYYSLSIKRMGFNANLGKFPSQDDTTLQAIIEWDPKAS
jgi:uncharacterized protein (DUF736 family)